MWPTTTVSDEMAVNNKANYSLNSIQHNVFELYFCMNNLAGKAAKCLRAARCSIFSALKDFQTVGEGRKRDQRTVSTVSIRLLKLIMSGQNCFKVH